MQWHETATLLTVLGVRNWGRAQQEQHVSGPGWLGGRVLGYKLLEMVGDVWSLGSDCQTGPLILLYTRILGLECLKWFLYSRSWSLRWDDSAGAGKAYLSSFILFVREGGLLIGAWLPQGGIPRDQSRRLKASYDLANHTMTLSPLCHGYIGTVHIHCRKVWTPRGVV